MSPETRQRLYSFLLCSEGPGDNSTVPPGCGSSTGELSEPQPCWPSPLPLECVWEGRVLGWKRSMHVAGLRAEPVSAAVACRPHGYPGLSPRTL